MKNLLNNEEKALIDFRILLEKEFGAIDVRLFGSRARGEGDQESDLDVFIVLPEITWEIEKRLYGLAFDLSLEHKVLLAPVLYSRTDIENPAIKASPLYKTVQSEGVKV
jgi:predicted nucleotidyltransferase